MTKEEDANRDIRNISRLLSNENKRYVIAVANALLFSQKCAETGTPSEMPGK